MPTTAYAMLRTDRSSAVCPSDLRRGVVDHRAACDVDEHAFGSQRIEHRAVDDLVGGRPAGADGDQEVAVARHLHEVAVEAVGHILPAASVIGDFHVEGFGLRSAEHTSELQSLMRSSYAVFCLKNKIEKRKYE